MSKPEMVDVAAALHQAAADVLTQARDRHAAHLAVYREGVRRMAATGGSLPPDEADKLLAACQTLDIPADAIEFDVARMAQHEAAAAEITAIEARNAQRQEPIPRLQAEFEKASAHWRAEKEECDLRLQAAQAAVTAARRALEKAHAVRMESSDPKRVEMLAIADRSPHLFKPVDAERLRRIIRPESRHSLLG